MRTAAAARRPTAAAAAAEQLGDDVSIYLDGGPSPIGVASTVVDLTTEVPRVLRQGAVSLDRLREVIGELELPD